MKKTILFSFLMAVITFHISGQTAQVSIGSLGSSEAFYDSKINSSDGNVINVGYTNTVATGNDLFFMKLNAHGQILWQKTIPNTGDDYFSKVIICSNGDYIAIGQMFQGGIRRGIMCRINSNDGAVIWAIRSSNTAVGDLFNDVVETTNNNIAVAAYEDFSAPQTNSYVILFNSSGTQLWSYISTRPDSDGFQTIIQMPNNNLLVSGIYIENSGHYDAAILELNEATGAVLNQNTYAISLTVPGFPYTINSLYPYKTFIRNNNVVFQMLGYQGYGSPLLNGIFIYNQATKNLSGNYLYHTGINNANGISVLPISETDFLVGNSYTTPAPGTYISRITNGTIVFDRKVNSFVTTISGGNIVNNSAFFGGSATVGDLEGYNLFCDISLPSSLVPCDISDANLLTLHPVSINPTTQSSLILPAAGSTIAITPIVQNTSFSVTNICGIVPVSLLGFKVTYNYSSGSSLLQWSTAAELNSKIFVIERSIDQGITYVAIGSVNAKGNTNNISQYQFIDTDPKQGINLYRLKQVDIDNKFSFSNIVSINVKNKTINSYTLAPMPAHGYTYIRSTLPETETIDVLIIDATGKKISKQKGTINQSNPLKINLWQINRGLYFIKILSSNNTVTSKKIVIE
ncbi:MAG: T9SS type A sorting domain-containing protein [Ferruginibacter sp.]